ncbi:MAG TPA: ribosome maturation factor RimP [Clostridiales bacterium]|nr:ribosome maturation factor RimP [Clostridiales bacterium]
MANDIVNLALKIGDELAADMGVSVVDAEFKKEAGKQYLRIFIDKENGVGIDDCEAFSRAFEKKFDKSDPVKDEYTLEVSSPGLDRKLKTKREFDYFAGREVDVKLFSEKNGLKEFSGKLIDFDGKTAKIEYGGDVILVNIKEAAYIRLHFEF